MTTTLFPVTVQSVRPAFHTLEGAGFEVRRAIPSREYDAIGPFIFLDHFGPIDVRPGEAKGAPDHPHAGIETVTLLLEGRSIHKDSLGNESVMRPGEAQWMRAGRGIVHDEGPDALMLRDGGRNHGAQLWLNLPRGHKHDEPAYRHFKADEIQRIGTPQAYARIVAGKTNGVTGPLQTFGHPFLAHVSMKAGTVLSLAPEDVAELGLYVMTGSVTLAGTTVVPGFFARLSAGGALSTSALTLEAGEDSEVLVVGGDPLDAPIMRHGPFVMNTIGELEQAVRDYFAGRMGRIS